MSARSLVGSVRDEAIGWVQAIGKVMNDLDVARVNELKALMEEKNKGLHVVPATLEDLKIVLNIVSW